MKQFLPIFQYTICLHASKVTCILLILFTLPFFSVAQAPVANFTSNITSGCAPLLVNFTDQSTGNPVTWRWDFGNNSYGNQANSSTTYFVPGFYTVKLVVTNAAGKDSVIKTNYINVLQPPQVAFSTTSSAAGCFPLRVQFNDNSVPSSGTTITAWEWDFGDGKTSTSQNPFHTYYSAGNFNVALKVTSSNGCKNLLVKPAFIRVTPGVKAEFSASAPINCKPPENINFTNNSTGPGTLTYQWNFGDGGISTDINPSYTYTTAGTFSVRLITQSSAGCVDTIIKPNQLNIGNFQSNFTFRDNVCIGDTVRFTNISAPPPNSSTWIFGDGTTSIVGNPIKTFNSTGNITVKLVNNYGSCLDSVIKSINIINNPVPDINANQTVSCRTPFTVNFTNTTPGVQQWFWDFGDGSTSNLQNPAHTYSSEGEFTVRLTVQLSAGCSGTTIKDRLIKIKTPSVSIAGMPTGGCFPYTFQPVAVVNTPDAIVSWLWNFGDGTTSTSPAPTKEYNTQGSYTITLTVTTSTGCTETVTYVDGVKTGTKPTANFSAAPLTACAGQPVNFTNLSTGSADQWKWVFGDGSIDTAANPSHTYDTSGTFSVKLIAFRNGCPDSITRTAYITILAPVSKFGVVYNCSLPSTISFIDSSYSGPRTYVWNFGDGNGSTLATPPPHTYAAPGTYTVRLTVTNGTCTHTSSKIVKFLNLSPVINVDQSANCRLKPFSFSATNIDLNNVRDFLWDMGDGNTYNIPTPSNSYTTTGLKTIKLVVTDLNGCKDSITRDVNVYGPLASFTTNPLLQCTNQTIAFNSTTVTDGTHPLTNLLWRFGDGNTQSGNSTSVQHAYSSPSSYLPKLIVTDSYGCVDSTLGGIVVDIIESKLGFTAADSMSCPGATIQFLNTSAGNNLSYTWDFGDRTTSSLPNPPHSYLLPGVYTVKLIGRESIGCLDSIIKRSYIVIDTPFADFNVSDTFTICPPLQVQFTNKSTYFRSLVWDFGDGNKSTSENPAYSYSIPGTYNISLTAVSAGGCTSIKRGVIKVLSNTAGTLTYDPKTGCFPVSSNFRISANNNVQYLWDFGDGSTLFTPDSVLSYQYPFPGFYVPKVIMQDEKGCLTPIIGIDTIKIFGAKADFSFDKTVLCDGGIIQFRDLSTTSDIISSYKWNFGDGSIVNGLKDQPHTYTKTGLYSVSLMVSTLNNCTNTITKNNLIKVVQKPQVSITNNGTFCTNTPINLSGNWLNPDTSAMKWAWKIDTVIATTQNLTNFAMNNVNTYTLWFVGTNSSGCADSAFTSFTINSPPVVDAGRDSTICLGNNISLLSSGADSYSWTPGTSLSCINCQNPVATPNQDSIRYSVTGTSANGCSNKDSVMIRVKKPFTVTASGNDTICIGQSVQLNASPAENYLWSPAAGLSNPAIANPVAKPDTTTQYSLFAFDDFNCFDATSSVKIVVYNVPVVNAGSDTTITPGSSVQLFPTLSGSISGLLWAPSTGLSCTTCPNPIATPLKTTTYRLVASNPGVCKNFDEVKVIVLCDRNKIFIPNAFTPDGDNLNDRFYILGSGITLVKSIRIYNRWGNKVFEQLNFDANDASFGWDGNYKGLPAESGIFSYTVEIACSDGGTIPIQGSVVLIR